MKSIVFFTFLILGTIGVAAQKTEIFQANGKALRGYDVVAFYTDNKAVLGLEQYQLQWNDAVWWFASREHLDSFRLNPLKYVPQYGGYCAYGTSDGEGHKAPTDPDTFTFINGKLYFNYNKKVKELWINRTGELIPKADGNWEKIKNKG